MLRLDLVRAALVPVLVIAMVLLDGQDQLVVAAPLLVVVAAPHLAVVVVVGPPASWRWPWRTRGTWRTWGTRRTPRRRRTPAWTVVVIIDVSNYSIQAVLVEGLSQLLIPLQKRVQLLLYGIGRHYVNVGASNLLRDQIV